MNSPCSATLAPFVLSLIAGTAGAQTWETCGAIHTAKGENEGDGFGFVRQVADTDGDDVADFVVGSAAGPGGGRGYLYSGRTGELRFTFEGAPDQAFSSTAFGAGDVNADGYEDIIFGAPDFSGVTSGAAYVFSGWDGQLLYHFTGEAPNDQFGRAANGVGDLNADGFDDFGVGAPQHASLGVLRGRVYIYSGQDGSELYRFDGDSPNDQMGTAVASLSDVDGDGHDDFIIGADQGFTGRGRAYTYSGATGTRNCTLFPSSTGAIFGRLVGNAGDVDGDTTPDFWVSDFADNNLTGRVRVYDGGDCSMIWERTGKNPGDTFGTGSGRIGDWNDDGLADLAFGALGAGEGARGQVELFAGNDGSSLGTINGSIAGDGFGFAVTGGSDMDGDGAPDMLVGVPAHDNGRGAVYALSSRPAPPRPTCAGAANSTGAAALVRTSRSLSIAANEMELHVAGAPASETGFYFYGADPTTVPFGDGLLCVAQPIYRIPLPVALDASGRARTRLDFDKRPFASGPSAFLPGSSWHLQLWYRDSGGRAGANLSNGLLFTLCP